MNNLHEVIQQVKETMAILRGSDSTTPERIRARRVEQEKRYEWYEFLLSAYEEAQREIEFWKEAAETQKNNNLEILKERAIMMDLLKEASEVISWRNVENDRKEVLKKIYKFVDSLSKEGTP